MIQAVGVDPRELQDVKDMMEARAKEMEEVLIPHWLWDAFQEEAADRGEEFGYWEDGEWVHITTNQGEAEEIRKAIEVKLVA